MYQEKTRRYPGIGLCVSNIFKRRCYWSEPKRQKDTENDTEKDTEQPKSSSASELVPILAPRRASKDGCIPISKSCAQHRIPALHTLWRIASLSSLMLMLFGHSNLSKLPRQKFVQRSLTRAKSCSLSSTNTVHHDA